jgi:hypothetical protein
MPQAGIAGLSPDEVDFSSVDLVLQPHYSPAVDSASKQMAASA